MKKIIRYKGRNYKAEVSDLIDRNGNQFTSATIKIGRNEIGLVWSGRFWIKP